MYLYTLSPTEDQRSNECFQLNPRFTTSQTTTAFKLIESQYHHYHLQNQS